MKDVNDIYEFLVQLISNGILSGLIFYWILRKQKRIDDFIIEKNKRLADKYIECEAEIFNVMNTVNTKKKIDSDTFSELSLKIDRLIIINNLYISDELICISSDFSNYLFDVSQDKTKRDRKKEGLLIRKFKSEFKK